MPSHTPLASSAKLLPPKQAARRLDHAESTLAKWRCAGIGPAYIKIGSKILYEDDELTRFIEARRVQTKASVVAA